MLPGRSGLHKGARHLSQLPLYTHILTAIVWTALIGTDIMNLIIIVAIRSWAKFAGLVPGQALAVHEREYLNVADPGLGGSMLADAPITSPQAGSRMGRAGDM